MLQTTTKANVNVCQATQEIRMTEMVAELRGKMNALQMLNAQNQTCVLKIKESSNVCLLVTKLNADNSPFASPTIISLNVNVHQARLPEIRMTSLKDVKLCLVFTILTVQLLSYATVNHILATTFVKKTLAGKMQSVLLKITSQFVNVQLVPDQILLLM